MSQEGGRAPLAAEEVDSTAQVDKPQAGFASANDIETEGAAEPVLGDQAWLDNLLRDDTAPVLGPVTVAELTDDTPARQEPTVDFSAFDLHQELSTVWGQDLIDVAAFEKIKTLKIVQEAGDHTSLVLLDEAANDEIEVGVTPDHRHVVAGADNVTAEQALSRALVAMTSDVIREKGVTVFGTEKDQALLLLAAEEAGLTVVNAPTLPEAVLAEAKAEWDSMMAARATAAMPAETVVPEEVVSDVTVEQPAAATEGPAVEPSLQELASGIEVTELPAEDVVLETATTAEKAAPAATAEDDGIPVLTDVVQEGLPKNVVDILQSAQISAEQYVKARGLVTDRHEKVVSADGIVKPTTLAKPFWEAGVGPKKAAVMLCAMQEEGLVTPTGKTVAEYKVQPAAQPAIAP